MLKAVPFTYEIEEDGKSRSLTVVADGRDYSAYEDEFNRSAFLDVLEWRYKCITFLVWHAMKRDGVAPKDDKGEFITHEAFMALTPQVHRDQTAQEPVPLEPTPSTGA